MGREISVLKPVYGGNSLMRFMECYAYFPNLEEYEQETIMMEERREAGKAENNGLFVNGRWFREVVKQNDYEPKYNSRRIINGQREIYLEGEWIPEIVTAKYIPENIRNLWNLLAYQERDL